MAALALLTALAAPPVLADPAPAPSPESKAAARRAEASECARARKAGKPCQLTIEPEQVGGNRVTPDGTDLRLRRFEPTGSMIRLRREFLDQIVQSTDEL